MSTPEDRAEVPPTPPIGDGARLSEGISTYPRYPLSSSSYVPGYPPAQPPRRPASMRNLPVWLAVLALTFFFLLVVIASTAADEESDLRLFAFSALESLPLLPISFFAYLGHRFEWARIAAVIYWVVLIGFGAFFTVAITLGSLAGPDWLQNLSAGETPTGGLPALDTLVRACASGFGVGFAILIGLLSFLPAVRRKAALVLPMDPNSFVHATALATVLALTAMAFVPLTAVGEPPLLTFANATESMKENGRAKDDSDLRATIYGFLWLVPGTIVAVGYPVRRNFREALRRVGLVRPRWSHVILALVLVPVFVIASSQLDGLIESIWQRNDWSRTDSKAFEEMMRFAINPLGAIVIGVTAGLGEELSVRGVLQPRLGILLSNLFFTSLHALQYNWDGLLSVFLIGLGLGVLRKYTNTTTSAIVHGGYDFVLVMLQVLENYGTSSS
jgi:uncharacterized protein